MKNINKFLNISGIVLAAAFAICAFLVMNYTAESNKVTVDVARIQSKNKTRVIQEVGLLTAEVRNLQKDMDKILEAIKKIERDKKNGKKTQKSRQD